MKQAPKPRNLDRERSQVNALANVFTKTNRILTGNREITVAVKEPEPGVPANAPAYSNGKNIVINVNMIKNLGSKATLMSLQGKNYHELCHIMFSPRQGGTDGIRDWVNSCNYNMAFNILEDQRIETLFIAIYKPARHYFIQMILDHIISDEKNWPRAHILLHGRRYIPKTIRDEFKARWDDKPTTLAVSNIIDEYRVMDLTNLNNAYRAKELIEKFNSILRKMGPQEKEGIKDHTTCQGQPQAGTPDKDQSSSAAEKAAEETKEQDEKEKSGEDGSDFWDDSEEEADESDEGDGKDGEVDSGNSDGEVQESHDAGSDDGEGIESDESDSEDGDVTSDGGGGEEDGDSDNGDDSDAGSSSEPSEPVEEEEKGTSHGVGGAGMTASELAEEMNEVLNAVEDSDQINEDVRQLSSAMHDPHNFDLDAPNSNTSMIDIPTHVRNACTKVTNEFRTLYAEMEPGWKYGSDEGRLNVNRAMNSEDMEDVFDEWDEGKQESAGLEIVIALDVSGSMQHYANAGYQYGNSGAPTPIQAACLSVWIMKRACEELGATVSVVGFGEKTTTIIPRHDKARMDKAVFVTQLEGDTRPAESFAIARWIMSESEMPHRLFVVVTDGAWGPSFGTGTSRYVGGARVSDTNYSEAYRLQANTQLPELLKSIDATKVYLGIGQACQPSFNDCFDINKKIENAEEIVPVVKSAIKSMMERVMR